MRETITLRKRIAILSSQLEENYQANFMQGFLAKAFAFDYDVCTFATYRKYQDTSEREVGETSIFSLIDYDAFDGVVVLPETLQTPGLMLTLGQVSARCGERRMKRFWSRISGRSFRERFCMLTERATSTIISCWIIIIRSSG